MILVYKICPVCRSKESHIYPYDDKRKTPKSCITCEGRGCIPTGEFVLNRDPRSILVQIQDLSEIDREKILNYNEF